MNSSAIIFSLRKDPIVEELVAALEYTGIYSYMHVDDLHKIPPLLKTNFIDVCQAIINGTLDKLAIEFEKKATVCKYLAPEGYPVSPKRDELVKINRDEINKIGARLYYASIYREDGNIYTTTSRAIGVLGIADNLEAAEKIAEQGVGCVEGNLFHRKDVGTRKLLQKRIDHMDSLLK